jgi:Amidohydrolase family
MKSWMLLLAALIPMLAGSLVASDEPKPKPRPVKEAPPPKPGPKKPDPKKPEPAKPAPVKPAAPTALAIIHADVYPITSGIIRDGTVLIRDGKIVAVGESVELPEGCEIVDAGGKPLLPGFVAARTTGIGLQRVSGKIADSLDPYDRSVELALAAGITTGFVSYGSSSAVFKMSAGKLDGMLVKEPAAETLTWTRSDGNSKKGIIDRFEAAKKYIADLEIYEAKKAAGDAKAKPPRKSSSLASYLRLLRGETPARFTSARTKKDVLACLALVDRYRFKAIIEGAPDAWRVGSEIARRGVRVIDVPRVLSFPDARSNEPGGSTVSSAARLREQGVRFTILPPGRGRRGAGTGISLGGVVGRDLFTLTFDAARAVSGGLSEAAALEAITIDAAEILGVDDRVGSIEPGKDADLILMSGDPLDYRTWTLKAWVNGRLAYEKEKSRLLSHIPVR